MKVIEVRRHGPTSPDGELTAEGRRIVEEAKRTLEPPYDAFYASPKARAIKTLEALGVTSYTVEERLGTLPGDRLSPFEGRVKELQRSQGLDLLEAYFALQETREILREKGREALNAIVEMAQNLAENAKALAVSHGGSIEPAALLALGKEFSLSLIGGGLGYCDGVKFYVDGGRFRRLDIIRLIG